MIRKKIIVVILVLSIIQSIYLRFINWGLPLKLDNAFLGLLFVGIGYVFKEMIFNKFNWNIGDEELLYLILHVNRLCSHEGVTNESA